MKPTMIRPTLILMRSERFDVGVVATSDGAVAEVAIAGALFD